MNRIRLKNFRCFREEQVARLAPLTLLVGDNSTGKTSFMAMVRALWESAYGNRVPDFKEDPYDLGSFDDIVYNRGANGKRADAFEAGFDSTAGDTYSLDVAFAKDGTVPVPVRRRLACQEIWIEEFLKTENQDWLLRVGTERGSWKVQPDSVPYAFLDTAQSELTQYVISPFFLSIVTKLGEFEPLDGSEKIAGKDLEQLHNLCNNFWDSPVIAADFYASAPVRSRPLRTYDPGRRSTDPEGDYVPMYLADLYLRQKEIWETLKVKLEGFGQDSGLFDEISVAPLGKRDSGPFQLRVRKSEGRRRGPWRNLVDVGYGVSQVLPLITELLSRDDSQLVLLQQPEVHLHPSAQAALGSLFCRVAAQDHQLIVETHSDYILDRVRMDIRDGAVPLKPDDISILFFERQGSEVRIHSLRLDEEGNILNRPEGYRGFFMEETRRSIGF